MHILAWILLILITLGQGFIFWYENYTEKGKREKVLCPSETKPSITYIFFISLAYLFYHYLGA